MWTRRCWCGLVLVAIAVGAQGADDWPQWGGPSRDFTTGSRDLAQDWGEDGPPRLWDRPLGGGFSSIVSDGKRLYTMYRDGDDEIVIALDPSSGKTRWKHRYSAPVPKIESLSTEFGKGPNGTPVLIDGRLVTIGFTGHVRCLDVAKGKLKWSHDLGEEFEVGIPYFGHSTSPLAVGKHVVVVAGGVFAFDVGSGDVVWRNDELEGSYGSPRLVRVGSGEQIVTPLEGHLVGLDPRSGRTLWKVEHANQWGTILTSPVIDDDGRVFISAAQVGSVLVDPSVGEVENRQVWKTEATQIAHSNAVRAGRWVFASVGGSASFVSATSLENGSQAWKERGFGQANLLRVGNRFLLLDFDGELALVDLGADGMRIVTRATINDRRTWTPPTLIGSTLYVRDESRIAAFDLGPHPR